MRLSGWAWSHCGATYESQADLLIKRVISWKLGLHFRALLGNVLSTYL